MPSAERDTLWRQALSPYFAELGVDASAIGKGPARFPFSAEMADVLEAFKPAVVSFHFGLPAPDLLARVRGWGAKILSSATTVDESRWLASRGVDAVIAQGLEAGGQRGMFLSEDLDTQVGTFALLPQMVRAVQVPVIAAGGIADARGVAAATALGAPACRWGRPTCCALKHDAAHVTALTNLFSGRPARGIVNRLMRELDPISLGHGRHRPPARQGGEPGQRRLFTTVGRANHQRLP